jgi:hypothetical protein
MEKAIRHLWPQHLIFHDEHVAPLLSEMRARMGLPDTALQRMPEAMWTNVPGDISPVDLWTLRVRI